MLPWGGVRGGDGRSFTSADRNKPIAPVWQMQKQSRGHRNLRQMPALTHPQPRMRNSFIDSGGKVGLSQRKFVCALRNVDEAIVPPKMVKPASCSGYCPPAAEPAHIQAGLSIPTADGFTRSRCPGVSLASRNGSGEASTEAPGTQLPDSPVLLLM